MVIFIYWLYFFFFFFLYYFYSIHFGSAFWLTNKFHFLTCVNWFALCSVCHLTVDGWRERIVLWKWFARSGEIGYQWRIWGNYFSWQSLKLVSAIFYQIFIFHQMIVLQKLWKMFFISSKKLFSFSTYSHFCIFVFSPFFSCQPLI